MILLGLTGSIGMGKTTIGGMFADRGVPLISADEIVHKIYAGRAAPLIEAAFPGSVIDGVVDRDVLSRFVLGNEDAMKRLEAIVHPLVHEEREKFVESARRDGARLVILDIPLLFETGGDASVDRVLVVTCDEAIQRERVLARPGMTEEKFEAIKSRQTPDAEKRRRADYVIDTSGTFADSEEQVDQVLAQLLAEGTDG
ncbi:dephospho-CoA kinase [Hoeflea sp. WL0058]|uniref:Dephospho-CoA kinase n=1 Tax=Flavimaribacter sediminis TaxID=2865987 RepID=A0AAE2ZRP2_9HYPH|nr:dephospho-CoA kinase [Flavimaribacter sediminis]MBW8638342.1 dephospho-CoA kinase [Flavimaribacter sediminis]